MRYTDIISTMEDLHKGGTNSKNSVEWLADHSPIALACHCPDTLEILLFVWRSFSVFALKPKLKTKKYTLRGEHLVMGLCSCDMFPVVLDAHTTAGSDLIVVVTQILMQLARRDCD